MREQTIAPRGTRRVATSEREFAQRPVRRQTAVGRQYESNPLRTLLGYVPSALRFVAVVLVLIALIIGYRVAASASLFQVKSVDVTGTSRTSADEIGSLTRRAASRTGVWRADLRGISAELERLPGVRRAIVTRVLPDRLRVRIIERVPVAIVRTAAGHFLWVDEDGVALGEMKAADRMPDFFIRGWNEEDGAEARTENSERIRKYLELSREWGAAGLSERVSEVNLIDVRDVRAQLAGNDSQIEVRLGSQDPGARLKYALDLLDERKQMPGGALITYIDLTQGTRAFVGLSSGGKLAADRVGSGDHAQTSVARPSLARSTTSTRATATDRNSRDAVRPRLTEDNRKSSRDRKSNDNKRERSRH
jgi:cell division septal protein FtsQ